MAGKQDKGITDFSKFNQYIHYKYDFNKTEAPEDGPDVTKQRPEEGAFYKEYPTSFPVGRNLDKYDRTSSSDACQIYCAEGSVLVSGYIYPHSSADTLENLSGQYLIPLNDSVLNRKLTKKQEIGQDLGLTFEELQHQIGVVGIRYWCSGTPTKAWVCPDGFYLINKENAQTHETPVPGSGGWDAEGSFGYLGNSCTSCKTDRETAPFRVPSISDVCIPSDFKALGLMLSGPKAQKVMRPPLIDGEESQPEPLIWTVGEVGVYDYDTFDLSFQGINGDSGIYPISGLLPEKSWHPEGNDYGKVIPSGAFVYRPDTVTATTLVPQWGVVEDKTYREVGEIYLESLSFMYTPEDVGDDILYHNHTWTGGSKWNGGGSFSYIPKRPTAGNLDGMGSGPWSGREQGITNRWQMTDMCYATRHPHRPGVHSVSGVVDDRGTKRSHIHEYTVKPKILHPSQYIIPPPKFVSVGKFNVYSGHTSTRESKQRRHAGAGRNTPKNIFDTPDLSKVDFSETIKITNDSPFDFSWINYGTDLVDWDVPFESIQSFKYLDNFELYWSISANLPFFNAGALKKPVRQWAKGQFSSNYSGTPTNGIGEPRLSRDFVLRTGKLKPNKNYKHSKTGLYEVKDILRDRMPEPSTAEGKETGRWPGGYWTLSFDNIIDKRYGDNPRWKWNFYTYYLHVWYGYTFDEYRVFSDVNSQAFHITETRGS